MTESKPALIILKDEVIETRVHFLKTWSKFYQAVDGGIKTHEFRKNDRDFKINDILELIEYDPEECKETGNRSYYFVTYILTHEMFPMIPEGWVDMSIRPLPLPVLQPDM